MARQIIANAADGALAVGDVGFMAACTHLNHVGHAEHWNEISLVPFPDAADRPRHEGFCWCSLDVHYQARGVFRVVRDLGRGYRLVSQVAPTKRAAALEKLGYRHLATGRTT